MNPAKVFVILTVCTFAIIFAAGVIASAVTPPAAEHARVQQKV